MGVTSQPPGGEEVTPHVGNLLTPRGWGEEASPMGVNCEEVAPMGVTSQPTGVRRLAPLG